MRMDRVAGGRVAHAALAGLFVLVFAACGARFLASAHRAPTPPRHPMLSAGLCPIIHCDHYQSGALPVRGPQGPSRALSEGEMDLLWSSPISGGHLDYTYPDGTTVYWIPKVDRILKVRVDGNGRMVRLAEHALVPLRFPAFSGEHMKRWIEELDRLDVTSQAYRDEVAAWRGYETEALRAYYAMVDRDGVLYVGGVDRLVAYGDELSGQADSPIRELRQFVFDPKQMNGDRPIMIGTNVTHDGHILAVTIDGTVVAVDRAFTRGAYHRLAGEQIWNGLSADEHGGVYVIGSRRMHKLVWNGHAFSDRIEDGAWSEPYEIGPLDATVRGRRGSGTAPVLMGLASDRDRFVAAADGADVNHLVLYWRDEIPEDWPGLPGEESRRIAGKVAVDFGIVNLSHSYAENAAVVLGYGAVLANNEMRSGEPATLDVQLRVTDPSVGAAGVHKFEWDPKTRSFATAWVRSDISNPNSTPVVSALDRGLHLAAVEKGAWVFTTLDWDTGRTRAQYTLGRSQRFNPLNLAVQLLPNGDPFYTTMGGVLHLRLSKGASTGR